MIVEKLAHVTAFLADDDEDILAMSSTEFFNSRTGRKQLVVDFFKPPSDELKQMVIDDFLERVK